MSFRTSLLASLDDFRALTGPTGFDIRINQLTIRRRTWAGGRVGMSGTSPHLYASSLQVLAPAATDLPTEITLVNELASAFTTHKANAQLHQIADVTSTTTAPVASDQSSANLLANQLKVAWNLHVANTDVHWTADAVNVVSAPNATDLASSITLANQMRTMWNAHLALTAIADSDLVLPARYKIRQLNTSEIAGSGGAYEAGDIIVEHITPYDGVSVGYTPIQLAPRANSNAQEIIYVITGSHSGEYTLRELRSFRPFSFDVVLVRRITVP